jgi:zinc protease
MRTIVFTLLTFLCCQSYSQVQAFQLNNGLKVLVKEDHRAPVAVSMIWYNVGSGDEIGGSTGLSHALEHMMFKGTKQYPLGVFSKTIADIGGEENAFTNSDYTVYFEKIAANQLNKSFSLEADRMHNLLLDAAEFSKEIKVIQEERRMRTDDNPQGLSFERFLATAHLTTPYHHPVIGWMHDLEHMDIKDLRAWYQQYYAPNNAVLVVVGDVQPKEVLDLAKHYFANIPSSSIPIRKQQIEPPALGKKLVAIHAPAQLPIFMIGYTVPGLKLATQVSDPYALELIAGILSAGDSARFSKDLIRGDHIASGLEAYYNIYARHQTQFIIYGAPNQSHTIDQLQNAVLAQLKLLQETPVSDQELQRVKTQIIAQKTFEKDSIFGQAMELGLLETIGLGWQNTNTYKTKLNSISPAQIQAVAKQYFQENAMTVAELIPTAQH